MQKTTSDLIRHFSRRLLRPVWMLTVLLLTVSVSAQGQISSNSALVSSVQLSRMLSVRAQMQTAAQSLFVERSIDSGTQVPPAMNTGTYDPSRLLSTIPSASVSPRTDGNGQELYYCAWDNRPGASSSSSYLAGSPASVKIFAVISKGLNGVLESSCSGGNVVTQGGDDLVIIGSKDSSSSPFQFVTGDPSRVQTEYSVDFLGNVNIGTLTNPVLLNTYGTFTANGATAIKSTLNVQNALTAQGDLSVGGTLTSTGLITANGGVTLGASSLLTANGGVTLGAGSLLTANGGINTSNLTLTGSLNLAAGTASTAPVRFVAGSLLTSSQAGALEFDGNNLYFTPSTLRKTVAFTDSNITGNAATASALQTARSISITGDGSWSVLFDGSSNASSALTLASVYSGPNMVGSATQVPLLTIDTKGRVVAASSMTVTPDWTNITNTPAQLTALGNLSSNGFIARTAAGTLQARTLSAGSGKITVTNGDGVAGNPTIDVVESALNLANMGGLLSVAQGGTGMNGSAAANGQLLIGNGTGYTLANLTAGTGVSVTNGAGSITINNTGVTSLAGTANQVNVSASTGAITLSLPQSIATTSTPTFGGLTLSGGLSGTTGSFTGAVSATRLNVIDALGNLAIGPSALTSTTVGNNTAIGRNAMLSNTTGLYNVALGDSALYNNTTANSNTAVGFQAMISNRTGTDNVAVGFQALLNNTDGSANIAIGSGALQNGSSGNFNTALGLHAMRYNQSGYHNVAIAYATLAGNTSGNNNIAIGHAGLGCNTTGENNTAVGRYSGFSNNSNPSTCNTTGSLNTFIGAYSTLTQGGQITYGTVLGAGALVGTSNTVVLGRTNDVTVIGATGDDGSGNKLQVTGGIKGTGNLTIGGTGTFTGAVSAASFSGNGAALTNLNASNISSGTLGVAYGGTGVNGSTATNGQLLIGNGNGFTLATVTGTANQVNVTNGAGSITLSLPQSIAASSTPTFAGQILTGDLTGTTATFSGNISAQRLSLTDSTGVSKPNLVVGSGALAATQSGAGLNTALGIGALAYNTSGYENVATGYQALFNNTVGNSNLALGLQALFYNTTGSYNVASGEQALYSNTTGSYNVGMGFQSLLKNTTGNSNLALGLRALYYNTIGSYNIASGEQALYSNTTGYYNVTTGYQALFNNTSGNSNLALGLRSLYSNTTGNYNVASGEYTLYSNTTGSFNAATGYQALYSTTTGSANVASGVRALYSNTTGNDNVGLGRNAGYATFGGSTTNANITGSNNTFIGSYAMPGTTTQLSYATALGSEALVTTSNTIALGRTTDVTVIGATGDDGSGNKLQVTGGIKGTGNLTIGGTGTFTGAVSAASFSGNGASLTNLNANNISSGTVGVAYGGTGINGSTAANGQLLIGNGSGFTLAAVTGTANQVNVTNGAGSITLSLPQSIAASSTPTFAGQILTGDLTGTTATFSGNISAQRLSLSDSSGGVSGPNLVVGSGALAAAQSGIGLNTALGIQALASNTSGKQNVATGYQAMVSNTTGLENVATGYQALFSNTDGFSSVATGYQALFFNTSGYQNVATGYRTLYYNTTGSRNIAIGYAAMLSNTTGTNNVASGYQALLNNIDGIANVATGYLALNSNTSGNYNVATGEQSLKSNTTGSANLVSGVRALYLNTTGNNNVALGSHAGYATSGASTTNANITGSNNTFVGSYAMPGTTTQLNYATALGSEALVTTSNTITLGRTTDVTVIGATGDDGSGNKLQVTGGIKGTGNLTIGGTGTFTGAVSAASFSGNGAALTNLNASNISSGIVGVAYGGTGVNGSTATNGQLLIGNGSGFTLATVTGTANQVNVSNGAGSITLSLPQSIATTSTPTFGALTIGGGITLNATGNNNPHFLYGSSNKILFGETLPMPNETGSVVQFGSGSSSRNMIFALTKTGVHTAFFGNDGTKLIIGTNGSAPISFRTNMGYSEVNTLNAGTDIFQINSAGVSLTTGVYSGNGSSLTSLNASNISSGTVGVAYGGTGVNGSAAANGQLLIGNGSGYTLANLTAGTGLSISNGAGSITIANTGVTSLTGTTNQVNVSASTGAVTLSLPQDIATTSTPTFAGQTLTGGLTGTTATFSGNISAQRLSLSDSSGGVSGPNLVVGSGALAAAQSGSGLNTALGIGALASNTSGYQNVATGYQAMFSNTTGYQNVATSYQALYSNTTGNSNIATGFGAMYANTTGYRNVALGYQAMVSNISGYQNVATGYQTLFNNTNGIANVATGYQALYSNSSGYYNVASGYQALYSNSTGYYNVASGLRALYVNSTGNDNVALGRNAGYATPAGSATNANTTGSNNTFVGSYAMPGTSTQLSYATALGSEALVTTSNTVVLGRTSDVTVIGGTGDDGSGNKLQVTGSVKATAFNTSSDRRLKYDISAINRDAILEQLKMLSAYQYRFYSDTTGKMRYGVIAQEIAPLFPNVVSTDANGFYTVDYGAVGALAASGLGTLANKFDSFASHFNFTPDGLSLDVKRLQVASIDTTNLKSNKIVADQLDVKAIHVTTLQSDSLTAKNIATDALVAGKVLALADARTSQAIVALNKDLLLNQLKQVTVYGHSRSQDLSGKKSIGLMAQELMGLFPETVEVTKDSSMALDYNAIVAIAAGAVGQLAQKVDTFNQKFVSKDNGQTLYVDVPRFEVSNLSAERLEAQKIKTKELEAERARIKELEATNINANSTKSATLEAEKVNSGQVDMFVAFGTPSTAFTAVSNGHYIVNTSAEDGSYSTSTVFVNNGVARVVPISNQGIDLMASGSQIQVLAASKRVKVSWIRMS